jgi:prevent-host-death family protein
MTIILVMARVNVFEVKARLSEYLDRAVRGERIIVCRHNRPVAELRGIQQARTAPRPVGPLPGRPVFQVPPAFFEPLSEQELAAWEGSGGSEPLDSPAPPVRRRSPRIPGKRAKAAPAKRKPTARRPPRRRP